MDKKYTGIIFAILLLTIGFIISLKPNEILEETNELPSKAEEIVDVISEEDKTKNNFSTQTVVTKTKDTEITKSNVTSNIKTEEQDLIKISPEALANMLAKSGIVKEVSQLVDAAVERHKQDNAPLTEWSNSTRNNLIDTFNQNENIEKLTSMGLATNHIDCKSASCAISLEMIDPELYTNGYPDAKKVLATYGLLRDNGIINSENEFHSLLDENNRYVLYIENQPAP